MIKRIAVFILVIVILFTIGFFINDFILEKQAANLSFSLISVYLFNAISSIIIYTALEVVINYLPNEAGYLYLGMLLMKFGAFILIYQDAIFSESGLTKPEKASTIIPIFIFLIFETISVSRLLNNK